MASESLRKMESIGPSLALDDALDLKKLSTTGSLLNINFDYNTIDDNTESELAGRKYVDIIGKPVRSFQDFSKQLVEVDKEGLVKKKVIEVGGGFPLTEKNTITFAFSGYWENDSEPFDIMSISKPMVVDLGDNDLLPGLQMAIKSMLVGELSAFLISYKLMYGELGVPPRIKPEADCVFYIKLIKSIITPKEGKLDLKESNIFARVHRECSMLLASGIALNQSNNIPLALQMFRKAVYILHKCRLADENEEKKQEKMLIKLYINLAIGFNKNKQPLKACVACNELNRLDSLWNNAKALYLNAKALRMIGEFDGAKKRLLRAMKLMPQTKDLEDELKLLEKIRINCNKDKLIMKRMEPHMQLIDADFKFVVDNLIRNFKSNPELCKLKLPEGLNSTEIDYIKETCIRENLFLNRISSTNKDDENKVDYALDKDNETVSDDSELCKDDFELDQVSLEPT